MGFSLKGTAAEIAPHASLIFVQMSTGGYIVLSKVMLVPGISTPVFLVYQFGLATILMALMALIFERSNRPPLTIPILFRIFLLSLLGLTMSTNLLTASLFFISSTVQAAVFNMVPVFIFLIAIISRQEKLGIGTLSGQGKLFGILLSVSGALVLTLWRGSSSSRLTSGLGDWPALGLVMVLLGVLSLSAWITLLGPMSMQYPADISLNALMFFFATMQCAVIAVFVSPVASQWKLKWGFELINIFFGAVCYNAVSNLFVTWCATVKGPTFIASFSPLGLLFATLLETIFLGHSLYMGSGVGAILIVSGLYIFLFSKSKEESHYYSVDVEEAYVEAPRENFGASVTILIGVTIYFFQFPNIVGKGGTAMALAGTAAKMAPHASMVFVQLVTATYFVLSKIILVRGISSTVFLVYQFVIATLFMSAVAFIFERRTRPPITKSILGCVFFLALVGITLSQNLLAACLYYITSTIETAIFNMIPIFTYILSIIARQEDLELNTWWGRGKLFGTLLSVSGASTLVFWKGSPVGLQSTSPGDWAIGLAMVVGGTLAFSSWILMLKPMARAFPSEFSLISLMLCCATLQQCVVAAIVSHKPSQWKLKWDLELVDILFGGALNSGLSNVLYTWCASLKGPVFVATFSPLTYAFAAVLETAFLGYTMHIGSVVGAVMIVVGLYIYLWSKAKEEAQLALQEEPDGLSSSLISGP